MLTLMLIIVGVLQGVRRVEAGGPVTNGACVAACTVGCALLAPPAFALCAGACVKSCTITLFCFHEDVTFEKESGEIVTARDVRAGDVVRTLDTETRKHRVWTKVLRNIEHNNEASFVRVRGRRKANNETVELRVTAEHVVIAWKEDGGEAEAMPAHLLREGDVVKTEEGEAVVERLERQRYAKSYEIHTEKGTVLASSVYVTTLCDDYLVKQRTTLSHAMKLFEEHKKQN